MCVDAVRITETVWKETCSFMSAFIGIIKILKCMTLQSTRAQDKFQLKQTLGHILWEEEGSLIFLHHDCRAEEV